MYISQKKMKYTDRELAAKLKFYKNLPEKARRHFLAVQYEQLGNGSQRYLAEVFKCSRNTIRNGMAELSASTGSDIDYTRQRKAGGGRKKKSKKQQICFPK